MKNNSLIEYKEGFFSRLKNRLKSIFNRDSKIETKETQKEQLNLKNSINKKEEFNNENGKYSQLNKIEFFELYNKVLKGEIELKSIDPVNLEKIYKILNEEVRIKKESLEKKIKVLEEKSKIIRKIANE